MSNRPLTTTSYAILGLLAIRPWATYDLAKVMQRSLHYFWPRAESNVYAEPKRLVEAGVAEAREEWNGERKRTVYSITEAGRQALEDWLATPSSEPRLESEPHLRLLYADHGAKDDLLATIDRIEADAESSVEHYARVSGEYARGEGLFPERIHVNTLIATLSIEQGRATAQWARWARAQVEGWDDTAVPDVEWAVRTLNEAIAAAASDAP
jgi:DNA-binding PadR family transcriptional regulator